MTLVELFDICQIENIITGLKFLPDKIIFVGYKTVMTKKRQSDLRRFAKLRGMRTVMEYEVVSRYDYGDIFRKLQEIVDSNTDCIFDLTGGKELVLVAMGEISAMRSVPMLQVNIRTGEVTAVKNCGKLPPQHRAVMSIAETVALNGGAVIDNDTQSAYRRMDGEFKRDIENLWEICRKNCGLWNRQSNLFGSFERFGSIDENFTVRVNLTHYKALKNEAAPDTGIIKSLLKFGLLCDYSLKDGRLSFRYKNRRVRNCMVKAGNILEAYIYILALEIAEETPGFYDEIAMGVLVDWDGLFKGGGMLSGDTTNEIDIMIMRNAIPFFISCKNGEIKKEALYELDTIANKFGGEYSRRFVFATYVSSDTESRKYILQRAKDMKIEVIEDLHRMEKNEIVAAMRKRVR
ncbi:MAG: hypothetical protein Q4C12_06070 [Clostridia bacterium]|nr:hypothetical protein [Clostridia bacterium]